MVNRFVQLMVLSGIFSLLVVPNVLAESAIAETKRKTDVQYSSTTEIPHINDIKQPATTVEEWMAQIDQPQVQVTGVQVTATDAGLEITLETSEALEIPSTSVVENALIADIPNAVLVLPDGNEFQAANPAEGIALVSVTSLPGDRVRVAITGVDAPPTANLSVESSRLVLAVVPGTEAAETDEDVIQVVVTGEQEEGYVVDDATTGTRTDTPLRDISQTIFVIPEQVLDDQQVSNLREVLRNDSGVIEGNSGGNTVDSFIIRGFQRSGILRNNFRDPGFVIRDTANLERIEILRGPASVLFGNLQPGGVINLITRQPLAEPSYSAELQVGSFGFVRPTIDLSGPLNSDRSLLYRLNAAYERSDGFRDFDQEIERLFISPVLTWQISDRTDLALEFEYLNDERPIDRGLVAIGTEIADIPFDRVLGEPDDVNTIEQFVAELRLEHRFSENWTLRNAFQFRSIDNFNERAEPNTLDEATGELTRGWTNQEDYYENYTLQTNLVGRFTTGSIDHTLLVGVDLSRLTEDFKNLFTITTTPSINIFDPVYGIAPRPEEDEFPGGAGLFNQRVDSLGIYLQDQITLLDNLKLLIGGRFDIIDQEDISAGTFGDGSVQERQDNAFTPRVGIVYQPIEPVSLYVSYSQSFTPNFGRASADEFLEPERGTQYEVGIRGELFDGRLSATLAAYYLTKSNVAVTDPDNQDFSIAIGEQRSQGIELSVVGEILSGWNIIASYAYTDAEIAEDGGSEREGNWLANVPENAASLWTTYEIQSGDLQGLGLGLGLFFVGERQGDISNTFQLPSYVRTDASLFYQRNNWRAAINIRNLFDIDYVESSADFYRLSANPGAPFTIIGSVTVEF